MHWFLDVNKRSETKNLQFYLGKQENPQISAALFLPNLAIRP